MPQMVISDFMPQVVWLCIVFPLLYFSMRYIALPRISDIISRREEKIRNDLSKAEEIRNKRRTPGSTAQAVPKASQMPQNVTGAAGFRLLLTTKTPCAREVFTIPVQKKYQKSAWPADAPNPENE